MTGKTLPRIYLSEANRTRLRRLGWCGQSDDNIIGTMLDIVEPMMEKRKVAFVSDFLELDE